MRQLTVASQARAPHTLDFLGTVRLTHAKGLLGTFLDGLLLESYLLQVRALDLLF